MCAQALDALGSGPRDAPARQRTLRATLEWSHRLLSAEEAEAFARFAVFAGGATVETAEEVTGAAIEALEGLVEKSLLVRESGRLWMLETVRAYAHELLDVDDRSWELRLRHCRHFVGFAERATPHLRTHAEAVWMRRLDAETDNLRASLAWALDEGHPALAVPARRAARASWAPRGASVEGGRWLRAVIEAAGDDAPLEDRALGPLRAEVVMLEDQGSWYDAAGIPGHQQEHCLRGGRDVSPRRRSGGNRRRAPRPQRLRAGGAPAHARAGGRRCSLTLAKRVTTDSSPTRSPFGRSRSGSSMSTSRSPKPQRSIAR